MKDFVSLDGEAIRTADGQDVYCLLAATGGESIWDPAGVSTIDAFRFLRKVQGKRSERILVGFGFTYDINRLLKDVDTTALRLLKADRSAGVVLDGETWKVTWTVGRSLVITPRTLIKENYRIKGWKWGEPIRVSETWGFFQTSFLAACKAYGVITEREAAFIESMKAARDRFRPNMAARLIRYNALECDLLSRLMTAYRDLAEQEGVTPPRWEGAGVAAGAVMKARGIRDRVPESLDARWSPQLRRAYFGGRIQTLRIGLVDRPVWNYDVNSAYPYQMTTLPSLFGRWRRVREYDPELPWAMWEVSWDLTGDGSHLPFTPFPVRMFKGEISYPTRGEGIYWSPLVRTALSGWDGITVKGGWEWVPDDRDERPFAYLAEMYARRMKYKFAAPPDLRGNVLKVPLNASFGKTCQTIGWRGDKPPPYMSFIWGGLITAGTQSELVAAALQAPDDVVLFSTDGLYSTAPLDLPVSEQLGDWDEVQIDGMFVLKPGLYGVFRDGTFKVRTRGWGAMELLGIDLLGTWLRDGPNGAVRVSTTRFVGLRAALHKELSARWNTWVTQDTLFRTRPGTGFSPDWKPGVESCTWITAYGDVPGTVWRSEEYEPKHLRLDPNRSPGDLELAFLEEDPDLRGLPE